MNPQHPCIFGEVLYDHFPDGQRVLGGAPFNVAWHLQAFGQAPRFVSRVGHDAEGDAIRAAMDDWGMDTATLQTDEHLPTGRVTVSFDDGEPAYDIVHPCAYDAIAAPDLAAPRLLYHGSLAVRDALSRDSLRVLTDRGPGTLFLDVNLRPPWWDRSSVEALLANADWVKLNTDELDRLHNQPGAPESFIARHDLRGLVLTHGAAGAEIITADGARFHAAPEPATEVVDTVGAGDAFASVVILGLLSDWPLDLTLQRAQTFASHIVGRRGATVGDAAFYQRFIEEWALRA